MCKSIFGGTSIFSNKVFLIKLFQNTGLFLTPPPNHQKTSCFLMFSGAAILKSSEIPCSLCIVCIRENIFAGLHFPVKPVVDGKQLRL